VEEPESRVVVHAEVPLAPLQRALEERVPQRLGTGRVKIGPGGVVSYSVDRGPLSVRVSSTSLLIEVPARAHAEACRGDDCYASCEPEARVVAEVPLMLEPDYRFRKTSVSAHFTRGCKVRALGGLLSLDITPSLEAALAPELAKVAQEIDAQLPEIEPHVARAWTELVAPRTLPVGGCFALHPLGLVQGPFVPSTTTLRARFAVRARPELGANCEGATAIALPTLGVDPTLPEEGVVRLGMVTSLTSVARALEAGATLPSGDGRVQVPRAEVTSRGARVDAQLTLAGEVCGDTALEAKLDFSGDGAHIGLADAAFPPGEAERLAASQLDGPELARALASTVRIAPLLSLQAVKDTAPELAAGQSRPELEVRARISSVRPGGASARGTDLVAWLEARGSLQLKAETFPVR
jgi:hypothetical protein